MIKPTQPKLFKIALSLLLLALLSVRATSYTETSVSDQLFQPRANRLTSEHELTQSFQLGQEVDRLCTVSNTENGTCYISGKTIRLSNHYRYKTDLNIVLDNTAIVCVTVQNMPCTLYFEMGSNDTEGGLVLKNGSTLQGLQIVIIAPHTRVAVYDTSTIDTTGQSQNTNGTQEEGGGASFVAQGGRCTGNQDFNTYGEFDMQPNHTKPYLYGSQLGSIGVIGDPETSGGGRIVVLADYIQLDTAGSVPAMQANALPYKDYEATPNYTTEGGSGGYIYVNTINRNNISNSIGNTTYVEAKGGYGFNDGNGGAGGVIIFENNFIMDEDKIDARAGQATNTSMSRSGCANGGAGTIWFKTQDRLIVDNRKINTGRFTILNPPPGSQDDSGSHLVAEDMLIKGGAQVAVLNAHSYVRFHKLTMKESSLITFTNDMYAFYLVLTQAIDVSLDSTWDFSRQYKVAINATEEASEINIGNLDFKKSLIISVPTIHVYGTITVDNTVTSSAAMNTYLWLNSNELYLHENSQIYSGFALLQANKTIKGEQGASVRSLRPSMCNLGKWHSDPFTCVPMSAQSQNVTADTFLAAFNSQFGGDQTTLVETLPTLARNFTIYLVSFGDGIDMTGTTLTGPRVGICANNINMTGSLVDTSGLGCTSDRGLGAGEANANCAGSGGGHGGKGGYGSAYNATDAEDCKARAPAPYFYKSEARYEGSGGGSGVNNMKYGGQGGGMIWLSTALNITLEDTKLLANGANGLDDPNQLAGSGGGAGGSIQIVTHSIAGDGDIQLKGGDGSTCGGGGGAGGRLVVDILESYKAQDQTLNWSGTFELDGGKAGPLLEGQRLLMQSNDGYTPAGDGQSGTQLSAKCMGGYSGPFCAPCEVGTYKFNYGYALCKPCGNKPLNAYYTQKAVSTSECPYQCSAGLEDVEVNQYCETSLEIQLTRMGGLMTSLICIAVLLGMCFIIWAGLITRSTAIRRSIKRENNHLYDGVLSHQPSLALESEQSELTPGQLHLRDADARAHTHRMYLIGDNSVDFPWYIPKDFPENGLNEQSKSRFLHMIKNDQAGLDWSFCQRQTSVFTRLLFPYLSDWMNRAHRRRHFSYISQRLYGAFDAQFWDQGQGGKTVRISTSTSDYQLAYIDFIDSQLNDKEFKGPKLPLCLMLAGNGTYGTPYFCNYQEDPLAKSIVHFNVQMLKPRLPQFFDNLNTLLAKLSFYKFNRATMRDLDEVIEWIDLGNKSIFGPLDIKATLYLFENSYQEVHDSTFKQRRRSMPLEPLVFEAFPNMYKNLIRFVQGKLMGSKSEIRLGLVFRPFDADKKRELQEHIKKMISNQGGSKSESVSMLFGDCDDMDEMRLNDINSSPDDIDASEAVLGSGEQVTVKILDKSKRAFDISPESTQALESALMKPKSGCKHCYVGFKAWWYSLWLLALKHHGKPPNRGSLSCLFFFYSISVSLDILLSFIIFVQVIHPMSNVWTFGVPWLFILPLVTVLSPIWGFLGSMTGSTVMLKTYSSLNATAFLVNIPLTIGVMIYYQEQLFYLVVMSLLMINKIFISFLGAKVRQHMINPGYGKNEEKLQQRFRNIVSARADILTKGGSSAQISASERAAMLVASGTPSDALMGSFAAGNSSDEADSLGEEDDNDTYGIVSKKDLTSRRA